MRYRILGPLEVTDGDRLIELPAAKHRALLALLLLRANEVISLDRLIDDLWDGRPPKTAKHVVQVYVSQLRKLLGNDAIKTRAPGYVLKVEPGDLDMHEFERLSGEGRLALHEARAGEAAELLSRALSEFRGTPLTDFAFEPFAQTPVARLEDLRLAVLEDRVDADLERGRHAELVAELMSLVEQHPLRERPRGQLMLALYRAGRQAEALECYQHARRALVDELGIDPSPALQELERAILQHDPSLVRTPDGDAPTPMPAHVPEAARSILILVRDAGELGALVPLAELLAASPASHDVILLRLLSAAENVSIASAELQAARAVLLERGVRARATAFTSSDEAGDLVLLATQQDVDLVLLDRPASEDGAIDEMLASVFEDAPCDVAVRIGGQPFALDREGAPVLVPFGGIEHDWAALELGAWLASAIGTSLRMLGSDGPPGEGGRDASRLLGTAALAVQQLTGVTTEPVLLAPGPQSVIEASAGARVVVFGCSNRWRQEGFGTFRAAVVSKLECPSILVHRGLRPGGLSPRDTLTRFTWSLAGVALVP